MKYYETTFEEYTNSVSAFNYHPELIAINYGDKKLVRNNKIFYGATGTGKYSQVLYYLRQYSPSALKYDKKMTIQTDKLSYQYRFSDIHYEIDMALLGCNSKTIWELFFNQVVDIISVKADKMGVIVCKNFHGIHAELLDIFYSYMKQYSTPTDSIFNKNGLCIHYILITEHVSFIPPAILQHCEMVNICRPHKTMIMRNKPAANSIIDVENIVNLKEIEMFVPHAETGEIVVPCDIFNIVCRALLQGMKDMVVESATTKTVSFMKCRGLLYDISIYQLDVLECLWFILGSLIHQELLTDPVKVKRCFDEIAEFLKYYNNNYRTIYHYESIFYFILLQII